MSKSNKPKTATAKFYEEPAMVEEVYTGYLYKSPGQSAVLKSVSSWKHRFFVLSKTGEDDYQLKYYTNSEKRDKPVGEIDLSNISLLFTGPEKQMCDWIQKHFSCTPASVLFLRVEDDTSKHTRDYFLIGAKSDDMNGWCNALVKAVKTQKPNKLRHTDDTLEDNRFRSISAPEKCSEPKVKDQSDERRSAPELSSLPPYYYDYPRKFSEPLLPVELKISVKEDEDEKETLEDNRFRSISAPEKCSEPKVKDQSDETQSAPELSSLPSDHYDYPRKFSEPLLPVERKISVKEDEDEKDGKQDESPEDSSEYMLMASLQMKLEDDQQEADTACIQTNTSINGHESSLCNGAVNQDDKNKCETHTHVEKEICVSPNSLKNSLILMQEEGKPCVSECRQIQDSCLFHKGDQILAFNGLRTDTVEEIHTYLRRLSKDEVKLTIRRFPGSQPLYAESCLSQ